MCRFSLQPAPLEGLSLIQRHPIRDQRGGLDRLFCLDALDPVLSIRSPLPVSERSARNQAHAPITSVLAGVNLAERNA